MNKVNFLPQFRIHSRFMGELQRLNNLNLENYLKSKIVSYGVAAENTSTGVYTQELLVEQVTHNPPIVKILAGRCIGYLNGEIVFLEVPQTTMSFEGAEYQPNKSYVIYISPIKSNYEIGTLTFTNGSKTVLIDGGNFNKVFIYESLLIQDSISGNNGIYKIASIAVNGLSLELVETFLGTTEAHIPFKILGYFGNTFNPDSSQVIYEYDKYVIGAALTAPSGSYKLAVVPLDADKHIKTTPGIVDQRSQNLYKEKGILNVYADSIINGTTKKIPTILQVSNADMIPNVVKDFIQPGIRSGFTITVTGGSGSEVVTVPPGVAYNSNGQRIEKTDTSSENVADIPEISNISVGYVYYYAIFNNNTISYDWSATPITDSSSVLLGAIYKSDTNPVSYTWEKLNDISRIKTPAIKLEGTTNSLAAGDLLYQEQSDHKNGKMFYYKTKDDLTGVEKVEIVAYPYLIQLINYYLETIRKEERLRFVLYPDVTEKAGWFLHQGIASPVLLDYKHRISKFTYTQVNVGAMPMTGILASDTMGITYNGYVSKSAGFNSPTSITIPAETTDKSERVPLGVYWEIVGGTGGKIQLLSGGTLQLESVELNVGYLYLVEVTLIPLTELEIVQVTPGSE